MHNSKDICPAGFADSLEEHFQTNMDAYLWYIPFYS